MDIQKIRVILPTPQVIRISVVPQTIAVGGAAWGAITGTLSAQTDLQSALDAKVDKTPGATRPTTLNEVITLLHNSGLCALLLLFFSLALPSNAADFGDIPANLSIGAGQSVRRNAGNTLFEAYTPGSGTGTVTSFSSGDLSPLFTTSVATATTTPALTFTLSNSAAHTFFANNTGSSGAPSFTSFVARTDYWDTTEFTGASNIGLVPHVPNTTPPCIRYLDETGSWTCSGGGGTTGGAPDDAYYLVTQSNATLTNEVDLGALSTGLVLSTVSTGVATISTITNNSSNWDTAYTDRLKWDGGATGLTAATGRTSLGGTTAGQAFFTLTNPSAITFPRINADNSVSALDASSFRTAIGAGTGGGDFSSNTSTSVDSEIVLFSGTTGKTGKRATGTGVAQVTSGVFSTTDTSTTATFGTIELGASTDTTIARSSAGHISVEGSVVGLASNDLSFFTTSTSNTIGVGHIELGAASDTTVDRNAAGIIQVEGVAVPTISSTHTLTNKRVTPRVLVTNAPGATPTINTDNYDAVSLTGVGATITSMTTNLSGTPNNFDKLIIRFKDDGTARGITWGTSFEAKGVALPTTTVISKVLTVGFIYDTVTSKWGCVASAQEQ